MCKKANNMFNKRDKDLCKRLGIVLIYYIFRLIYHNSIYLDFPTLDKCIYVYLGYALWQYYINYLHYQLTYNKLKNITNDSLLEYSYYMENFKIKSVYVKILSSSQDTMLSTNEWYKLDDMTFQAFKLYDINSYNTFISQNHYLYQLARSMYKKFEISSYTRNLYNDMILKYRLIKYASIIIILIEVVTILYKYEW